MKIHEWIINKINVQKTTDNKELYDYYSQICDDFGFELNYDTYCRTVRMVTSVLGSINTDIANTPKSEEYEETTDTIKARRIFTRKPQTLDEVLKMFEVDSKVWECYRWKCSNWDVTSTKAGATATNYSVRAEFKRRIDIINYDELLEKFMSDTKSSIKTYSDNIPYKMNSKKLLEIPIMDLHLAKLGWGSESGEDYDHRITCDLFMRVIQEHIEANIQNGFDKILFPIGQDFFNFDTIAGTTTAGTPQTNSDIRWQKMFDVGCKLLVDAIEYLSQYANVDVLYVPGNHDHQTSFYATMYLYAWFNKHPNVTVDISPKARKYRLWGNCLIGFTHGDKEKKRIQGIMQVEVADDWGKSKYREFHCGHLHSEQVTEVNGLIIRNISSITASDSWHYNSGYVGSVRKSPSFLWDYDKGLINIYNAVIEVKK